MITVIGVAACFLPVLAVLVQVLDAVTAAHWRMVAAERRRRWEARQKQLVG